MVILHATAQIMSFGAHRGNLKEDSGKRVWQNNYSEWPPVYVGILFMWIHASCEGSLETTHQTTVGAILVDSHSCVAMYRVGQKNCAKFFLQ